jgi:hypothetical protein
MLAFGSACLQVWLVSEYEQEQPHPRCPCSVLPGHVAPLQTVAFLSSALMRAGGFMMASPRAFGFEFRLQLGGCKY